MGTSDSGLDTIEVGEPDEPVALPTSIGRYAVVGVLGRGGMGTVYRCVDEDLERHVAVKVLDAAALRKAGMPERESLLLEAKALARLNHPNVVSVYEVGEDAVGLFIAMELVDGDDLRTWLKTGERARAEVMARFIEAGRGLQAAHDAGLVHRDFKPSNVLVAERGAKVTDFGLAQASETEATVSISGPVESTGARPGTVMGTPPYMSPEQHRSELLDPASDQFSFCVALYEALTGERPFTGRGPGSLLRAKRAGPPSMPARASVPAHVERAVARGLSAEPSDRFASMSALLRELERDPAATRRRVGAALGLICIGGGAAWLAGLVPGERAEPCQLGADAFDGVWDPRTERAIEEAFMETGQGYAAQTHRRVNAQLDRYVGAWTQAWSEACRATAVSHVQSQRVLDMRIACLDERRASLRALTGELATATVEVLDRADSMVRSLPPLEVCSNLDQLEAQIPDPTADAAEEVGALRAELATARVMQAAGRSEVALATLERLTPRVERVEYRPLIAELMLLRGQVLDALARHEGAEVALSRATWTAYGVDYHRVVAYAAMKLVWNVSDAQSRGAEGKVWLGLAAAASERVPDDEMLRAEIANTRGVLLQDLGDRDGARKAFESVLALLSDASGPESLTKAGVMVNLAILESEAKHYERAYALQKDALALRETYEGRAHPRTAALLNNMSTVLVALDRHEEARAANAEALAQLRSRYGGSHPLVGTALVQTATLAFEDGALADAAELLREAAEVFEAARGPMHRDLAVIYNNVGLVELEIGNADAAVEALTRALEIVRANYDEDAEKTQDAKRQLAKARRAAEE